MSVVCPACGKIYRFNGKSYRSHTEGYLAYTRTVDGTRGRLWINPVCDLKNMEVIE